MTTADAPSPTASALRLVLAAERLFATRGIDGVSLRQIAAEAGSSNNSAVHYHFGSKHGLTAAIFRYRLPQIISERRLLAARCDPDDLRSRFEAHFLPVLTMAEATDNHYVSFVEQIQRMDLAAAGDLLDLPAEGARSNEEFRRDLQRRVGDQDGAASSLFTLGRVVLDQGAHGRARGLFVEALELSIEIGYPECAAYCLAGLGQVDAATGDIERAVTLLGAADALFGRIGARMQEPEQSLRDAAVDQLRNRLGAERFATVDAAGRQLDLEEAAALARRDSTSGRGGT